MQKVDTEGVRDVSNGIHTWIDWSGGSQPTERRLKGPFISASGSLTLKTTHS